MQGRPLKPHEIRRIARLLRETDLSMNEIARTTGVTSSTVARVNTDQKIRLITSSRSWTINRDHTSQN